MKKCEEFAPLLSAFVDGELTEEERAEVLAHVSECEKCRRLLGELTALHAALGAQLWKRLTLEAGHVEVPKQYANLYGTPFMGTLSTKIPGMRWHGTHNTYLNAAYTYRFSPAYALSAQAEFMNVLFGGQSRQVFSFGVYFRVSPSFLIKRWK